MADGVYPTPEDFNPNKRLEQMKEARNYLAKKWWKMRKDIISYDPKKRGDLIKEIYPKADSWCYVKTTKENLQRLADEYKESGNRETEPLVMFDGYALCGTEDYWDSVMSWERHMAEEFQYIVDNLLD